MCLLEASHRPLASVRGFYTPRGYGSTPLEDKERAAMVSAPWQFADGATFPVDRDVFLEARFFVNPSSADFRGNCSRNGKDVDTMLIGMMGGLVRNKQGNRPTTGLITDDRAVEFARVSKVLVGDDGQAGTNIYLSQRRQLRLADWPPVASTLSFTVPRGGADLRERTFEAVAASNAGDLRVPSTGCVSVRIAFAGHVVNIVAADKLEALIDGLGKHLFDPPRVPSAKYDHDDSVVFSIEVARVHDLPPAETARVTVYC